MAQGPIQRGDKEGVDYLSVFLAGTVGGAVQLGVACPVELVEVSINQKSNDYPLLGVWRLSYWSFLHMMLKETHKS